MLNKVIALLSSKKTFYDISNQNNRSDYIASMINARELIMEDFVKKSTFIDYGSLGQNCMASWYLKQVGLKKTSLPFDWIFSSLDIIEHAIDDKFSVFLDPNYFIKGKVTGHRLYHQNMFNHKSPLGEDNYSYYKRCCDRFLKLLNSDRQALFMINLINEPSFRKTWSTGFTEGFPLPVHQDINRVETFVERLNTQFKINPKFLFIDARSNSNGKYSLEHLSDNVSLVKIESLGLNNGVHFINPLDDFCFKCFLTSFY